LDDPCADLDPAENVQLRCGVCSKRFIYLGMGQSLVFLVLKVWLGISSGSRALVAAGLYSLQDLASTGIAAIGLRISIPPPDRHHPYGHGKIEYLVVGFTSMMILLALAAISITSLATIFEEGAPGEEPSYVALWVALLSGVSCWLIAHYQECAAEKLNSPALNSCAVQFHGDVICSVAVVASVLCAKAGYQALDHIVAILEAVDVVAASGKVLASAIGGLMDSAADDALLEKLRKAAGEVEGVLAVQRVTARWSGQTLFSQIEVELSPRMTVAEADLLRARIRRFVRLHVCARGETLVRVKPSPADADVPAPSVKEGLSQGASVFCMRPRITI